MIVGPAIAAAVHPLALVLRRLLFFTVFSLLLPAAAPVASLA
jgi:hypothetical protein